MNDRPARDPETIARTSSAADAAVLDPAVVESLRRLGDRSGRDVLRELTALFLSTADGQVAAAAELLDRSDLPGLARIAHALKGSAGVIGARRVAAASAALEQTCGHPERTVAGGSVDEARAALTRFVGELEEFRRAVAALGLTG